jgi:hypothetical protein
MGLFFEELDTKRLEEDRSPPCQSIFKAAINPLSWILFLALGNLRNDHETAAATTTIKSFPILPSPHQRP